MKIGQKIEIVDGFYQGFSGNIAKERLTRDIKEYFIEIDMVTRDQSWLQPKAWIEEGFLKEI